MVAKVDSLELFHSIHVDPPTRTVYLGSEEVSLDGQESRTDAKMAERLIKNLHYLDSKNNDPITIMTSNSGGDVYDSLAIYDAIRLCKSHVTMKVFGKAMSAGSFILQAADHRIATSSSRLMIHYGYIYIGEATPAGVEDEVHEWNVLRKAYERVYLDRMRAVNKNVTEKRLRQLLLRDTYLSAQEALEMGLVDEVV